MSGLLKFALAPNRFKVTESFLLQLHKIYPAFYFS